MNDLDTITTLIMRRLHSFLTLLFSAALICTLPACDSDGDGDGDGGNTPGSVNVTITGDYENSFSGSAFFTVGGDDDVDFGVGLVDGNLLQISSSQVVAFAWEGDRPGTGTYSLDDDGDEFSGGYVNLEGASGNVFNSLSIPAESGSVTITSSSADRVAGSFTFTGTVADLSNPTATGTATVSGTFTAEFIDPDTAPDPGGF